LYLKLNILMKWIGRTFISNFYFLLQDKSGLVACECSCVCWLTWTKMIEHPFEKMLMSKVEWKKIKIQRLVNTLWWFYFFFPTFDFRFCCLKHNKNLFVHYESCLFIITKFSMGKSICLHFGNCDIKALQT